MFALALWGPHSHCGKAMASTLDTLVFPEASEGWITYFLGLYLINVHRQKSQESLFPSYEEYVPVMYVQ